MENCFFFVACHFLMLHYNSKNKKCNSMVLYSTAVPFFNILNCNSVLEMVNLADELNIRKYLETFT